MIIGYARVSTQDQQTIRQIDQLKEFGCERIYEEKVSGTKRDREELNRMMDALREGDVVVITELSRLSRSVKDLFEIVDKIHTVGADIKSLKESWIDTTSPQGKLLFWYFKHAALCHLTCIVSKKKPGVSFYITCIFSLVVFNHFFFFFVK